MKSFASPSASQRGACADRDVLNKDSTSYSISPHTVSSDRRAAFVGVRTPHAARLRTANPGGETDQPTVGLGAKSVASPSASQRGACADRDVLNKDSTSYSISPHTVSSDRRAAFDGVRTPHAVRLRTANPGGETDQPTVDLGAKSVASPSASQRGACADRDVLNKDSTSYSISPHTVSSDRRAAFDGVRTPHAARSRTANPGGETDQPTVGLGAKSVVSPSASQQGECAGRDGLNTDSTSFSTSPHTVSSDRRTAFDDVQTPHAARLRTANPGGETDQPTVGLGAKSFAAPSASQRDKERRSITVSQTYYNSVHDQFPSNSSNSEHHTVHRAPQGARAISVSASTSRQDKASHRHPRTSKQGRSKHNKVSSYFNCKSKSVQSLNTIPPVGCTVTSTNNSTSLDTVVVSDASHPDRLFSSVGHGIVDHSHDLHSGHPRHDRLPSELLAISTQDHTSDTTDNNPLDISDKILNTDHPIQASPTLRILESLADDGPDHEIDESNLMPGGGHDGVNTQNLEFRDLSVDPSTTDSDGAHKSTVQHSGTNGPIRDMGVSADTRATHSVTRKRVRDASISPDKTHKKIVGENGTIRKTVTDIPKTKRNRFFKIKYVPGRTVSDKSPDPSPISVSQQADEKKELLNAMTPDQRKDWHVGRNAQLSADKAASRYSWVDQALENQCNTHWAFGTIGLPSWLTTDQHTVNSIFQIRSNAAREIMEVAREHLRRDNLRLTADAETILNSVTDDLQPAQARASKRLVDQHATRHMLAFTEDLSERREWLINHQPTLTEAISMRPDINPKNTVGALPAELLSDDEAPTVRKTSGAATHEGSPPKRRKNRPKKRTRQAAKSRNGAQQTDPKTTPSAGQVPSARPNDARPNDTPKTAATANHPPARRHNPTSSTNYKANPDRRRDDRNDAPTRDRVRRPQAGHRSRSPRRDGQRDYSSNDRNRDHRQTHPQGSRRSRSPHDRRRQDDHHTVSSAGHTSRDNNRSRGSSFREGQRGDRDTRGSTNANQQSRRSSPHQDNRDSRRHSGDRLNRRD